MLTRKEIGCSHSRRLSIWRNRFSTGSVPLVSTRQGRSAAAWRRMRTKSLTMNGSPPVNENCRTPRSHASAIRGRTSSSVIRSSLVSPGFEPSRQNGQARLQAVPVWNQSSSSAWASI